MTKLKPPVFTINLACVCVSVFLNKSVSVSFHDPPVLRAVEPCRRLLPHQYCNLLAKTQALAQVLRLAARLLPDLLRRLLLLRLLLTLLPLVLEPSGVAETELPASQFVQDIPNRCDS